MKKLLLLGSVLPVVAALDPTANATSFDFTYSGTLVNFTLPTTGVYQILAFGAQGGTVNFLGTMGEGGRGAEIGRDFSLPAAESLQIAVGDNGSAVDATSGGGGGGSFVVGPGNTPLIIAGGGGCGRIDGIALSGQGGLTGPDGGDNGGSNGNGGRAGCCGSGGGGGGFLVLATIRFLAAPPAAEHSRPLTGASWVAAFAVVGVAQVAGWRRRRSRWRRRWRTKCAS